MKRLAQTRLVILSSALPALAGMLLFAGCRGDKPAKAPAASAVGASEQEAEPGAEAPMLWDPAAGPALLLATDAAPESVVVVKPEFVEGSYADTGSVDLRGLSNSLFDLFGRGGSFGSAVLHSGVQRRNLEGCTGWPDAVLSSARPGWRVALASGRATAVPLDSIEALSPADSAQLAVEVTRLAAGLRSTQDALFATIPFVVRSAYRFRTAEIDGIAAALQRSIHSEANPREEHVFIIAERPVGSSEGYRVALSTRQAGEEGSAPVTNVLAAVTLGGHRKPALLASVELENGGSVEFLERVAPGRWRMTWRSAYTGCDD